MHAVCQCMPYACVACAHAHAGAIMAAGTNALLNVCDGGTVCCGFKPNAADPHRKLLRSESDSKQARMHVAIGSHGYRLACMWLQARVHAVTGSRVYGVTGALRCGCPRDRGRPLRRRTERHPPLASTRRPAMGRRMLEMAARLLVTRVR